MLPLVLIVAVMAWLGVAEKSIGTSTRVACASFALLALGSMSAVVHVTLKSATVTDEGVRTRGLFGAHQTRWAEIGEVLVGTTSRRDRALLVGGAVAGGIVGHAAVALARASTQELAPFAGPGPARAGHAPRARLRATNGRNLASYYQWLGWPFFDALLAEAEARGIPVRAERQRHE